MTSVSWVERPGRETLWSPVAQAGWQQPYGSLTGGWRGVSPVSTKSHQFPPTATTRSLHPWLSLHTKDLGEEAEQGTIFQDLFEDTMSLEPNSFQIHEWALDCPDIMLSSSNFSVLSLLDQTPYWKLQKADQRTLRHSFSSCLHPLLSLLSHL